MVFVAKSEIQWSLSRNHKSGIPTGFIFVKLYCYEFRFFLLLLLLSLLQWRHRIDQIHSSHLSTTPYFSARPFNFLRVIFLFFLPSSFSHTFTSRSSECFVVRYLNSFLLCEWKQRHCYVLLWWNNNNNNNNNNEKWIRIKMKKKKME